MTRRRRRQTYNVIKKDRSNKKAKAAASASPTRGPMGLLALSELTELWLGSAMEVAVVVVDPEVDPEVRTGIVDATPLVVVGFEVSESRVEDDELDELEDVVDEEVRSGDEEEEEVIVEDEEEDFVDDEGVETGLGVDFFTEEDVVEE
ncbi:hypothetical protein C0992_009665 [Termitomyces sp. T32_za158]|nr:hypothetical protein C0992_009665 [Termitomyces sp. T32_za158]